MLSLNLTDSTILERESVAPKFDLYLDPSEDARSLVDASLKKLDCYANGNYLQVQSQLQF
jgi:hypothetical protein